MSRIRLVGSLMLGTTTLFSPSALGQTVADPVVDEIVVTASRHMQRLADAPVAATVITESIIHDALRIHQHRPHQPAFQGTAAAQINRIMTGIAHQRPRHGDDRGGMARQCRKSRMQGGTSRHQRRVDHRIRRGRRHGRHLPYLENMTAPGIDPARTAHDQQPGGSDNAQQVVSI